jgi:hypothetical protein
MNNNSNNDKSFDCRDCEKSFTTAKAFVDHTPYCQPYNSNASLHLQNAAMFLRDWVKISGNTKLRRNTMAWLVANKLQGDLK